MGTSLAHARATMHRKYMKVEPEWGQGGFSATELIVTVGVIGILMAASAPFFLSYLRTSALRGGAEEMAAVLNRARQIAIHDNTSMCVTGDGIRVQFRIATCGGTIWARTGTDGTGFIRPANGLTVARPPKRRFMYMGQATPSARHT